MSITTAATSLETFEGELALDRLWSRSAQRYTRILTTSLTVIGGTILSLEGTLALPLSYGALAGGTLIFGGIATKQWLLWCYHNTAYYRGLASYISSKNYDQATLTYDVAEALHGHTTDLTKAFLTSQFGASICQRAGLQPDDIRNFLASERPLVHISGFTLIPNRATTLVDLAAYVTTNDHAFRSFVTAHGSSPETVVDSCRLQMSIWYTQKRAARWWGRDQLSRRGALGRRLSYGLRADGLLHTTPCYHDDAAVQPGEEKIIKELAHILAASRDSNVLLVAPEGMGSDHIIGTLAQYFKNGTALNAIAGLQLLAVDPLSFTSRQHDAGTLEHDVEALFQDAVAAGNITLVFRDAYTTIKYFTEQGIPFAALCEEYLGKSGLHIILTATPKDAVALKHEYHYLTVRCEEVAINTPQRDDMLTFIESHVFAVEVKYRVLFLYSALTTLAEALFSYSEPTYDMAKRFLVAIAEESRQTKSLVITRDMVHQYLSHTTGMPIGPLLEYERDFLLHAEETLGNHIVGQPRAVTALAKALRRSRIHLTSNQKPHASFLFLGPTGVGKTETAKVLASLYIHARDALLRLDMSEYASPQGLHHLIGTEHEKGILTEAIAEQPHRVLLLDEFEKADKSVQNLFLQILDEGYYTSGEGQQVNLRHCLIIATSNAGGDLIAKTTPQRTTVPALDSNVIEHIVSHNLLSRELINRFDDVILFDTLTVDAEIAIAHQLTLELADTMKARGFNLIVDTDALTTLAAQSHNPSFGARPLRHHFTETLGDIISKRIIRGEVKPGDTITITKKDLII